MTFLLKVLLSSLLIAGASELSKRSTWMAAILVSLPLSSILTLSWVYFETRDVARVSSLSMGIFWALPPSLLFLVALSALLKRGVGFGWAMAASCAGLSLAYGALALFTKKAGLTL